MERLDSGEIIKLLENLIGETEAVGDSWADEKIEKNLMTLIDVANWCVDGVAQSSETKDRTEWSMRHIGGRAFGALLDWKEWLAERTEGGKRSAEPKPGKWIHGRETAREMIGDCITAIFYEDWK